MCKQNEGLISEIIFVSCHTHFETKSKFTVLHIKDSVNKYENKPQQKRNK